MNFESALEIGMVLLINVIHMHNLRIVTFVIVSVLCFHVFAAVYYILSWHQRMQLWQRFRIQTYGTGAAPNR